MRARPCASITGCPGRTAPSRSRRSPTDESRAADVVGRCRLYPGQRRLPVEIVAYVGVAIGRIEPQATVEWKGMIELRDPLARVADGWRNVRGYRRLGHQRWRA